MQNLHQTLGIIAGVLALVGYIPYIISIFAHKTRPNKASWFIWTLVGGLLAFSYIATGDKTSIWLPLGYFLGPFITAILSIRYGYAEWSRLDKICVITAVMSLVPWLMANNPLVTLYINMFIDLAGALPTIVKTYREPESEDFIAWFIFFIANTLEVFSVSKWTLAGAYPIYLFFLAGTIVLLILKDKIKEKFKKKSEAID